MMVGHYDQHGPCAGGYMNQHVVSSPHATMSGFGNFGQGWSTALAQITGALATAGATIYGLNLQAKAAKSAEHQRQRELAAAQAAQAAQVAQKEAEQIQIIAAQQAETAAAPGGVAPTGGGVLASLKGIPTWAWLAGGGLLVAGVAWKKLR